MKKALAVLLPVLILAVFLCGCDNKPVSHSRKLSIVTTAFPQYDWVRNILGEKAADTDLTLIPAKGVDPHSFRPTADDITGISQCDLLIYAGGESDQWVEDALNEAGSSEMIVIRLLDVLEDPVTEEENTEGAESTAMMISYLRDALIEADPTNAAVYTDNAAACLRKLKAPELP